MDQNILLYVMTAFVIIAAIALCIQAAMLVAVSRTTKTLQGKIEPLVPKVEALVPKLESLMASTKATVELSKQQIAEITTQAREILASTKSQLAMVEEVVTDATARAKVQMERVELVLDDTVSRAHETVALVHTGIMKPLREIQGVAAGIRTVIQFLMRSRPNPTHATSDEEMFI